MSVRSLSSPGSLDVSGDRLRGPPGAPAPLLRSPSELPRARPARLRPILCRSHSVADTRPSASTAAQKRSVTFQLPADADGDGDGDGARSRVAALAHSLWRLTRAAGRPKPEKAVKRILRQPVVHVYLRGASGLPTQRVPLATVSARHQSQQHHQNATTTSVS